MRLELVRSLPESPHRRIAIVGAGLVGPVLAIFMARRGCSVEIYEKHDDPRKIACRLDPSINITLCLRGMRVLERIGAGELIQGISTPAFGRMIHLRGRNLEYQAYGNNGECLYSLSRGDLNSSLLDCATREPGVTIRFNERFVGFDCSSGTICTESTRSGLRQTRAVAVVIGADGAHSTLRRYLQAEANWRVLEKRSDYANKELMIPSTSDAPSLANRNALHVWPRGKFMMIGFPNRDGSTTCTLNLPRTGAVSLESLATDAALMKLFRSVFSDMIGVVPDLALQYSRKRAISMISVLCSAWSHAGRALLIGDAAHAFWPSYGQGANAGFEDCAVLDQCIVRNAGDWRAIFSEFERLRRPNTDAMTDLSERHFQELRQDVASPTFLVSKRLERELNQAAPDVFVPLYNLISFTTLPYIEALMVDKIQRPLVERLMAMKNVSDVLQTPEFHDVAASRRLSYSRHRAER